MLKTVIAHSLELDTSDAIEDVIRQSQEQLKDDNPQAGLLFAGIDHDHSLILKRIKEEYPEIQLIGGTTGGELSSVHGVTNESIVLALFCSDDLYFKTGLAERISEDTVNNLENTVERAKSDFNRNIRLCITFPSSIPLIDGVCTPSNSDEVMSGLISGLGDSVQVVGGCSFGNYEKGDFQFYNFGVYTDSAPFLFISGSLLSSIGVDNGYRPIGKKNRVTHSDKNKIFKIGDQSALAFYEHYLGKSDVQGITEFPLAVFDSSEDHYVLRGAMSIDEKQGSILFSGNVPEGLTVQLSHTTRDQLLESVHNSVNSALSRYPGSKPSAVLCFSCGGRNWMLGTRVKEEYEVLKKYLPDLPVAGFYAAGEIGLLGNVKDYFIHNYSFVSLLMGTE